MAKRPKGAKGSKGSKSAKRAKGSAQELVDELATAAGRVRDAIEDLRLPSGEGVGSLRARLDSLERRVAEVERAARGRRPPRAAPKRGAAKPGAAKPGAAKRSTAKRQAAGRSARRS